MTSKTIKKFEIWNTVEEQIKFLSKSQIRIKILKYLLKEPYAIKEIVEESKINYSSVSSNIANLMKNGYIEKIQGKFYIKPLSRIYMNNIVDLNKTILLLNDFDKFWNKHDLSALNEKSLSNITNLYASKLIESSSIDIYKTHNIIKDNLYKTNELKAIFPYVHPEYPEIIENMLLRNSNIELIISSEIYDYLMDDIYKKYPKEVKNKNFNVYTLKENIKLYLVICKRYMALGLFKNDGSFDQNRLLISSDENALNWADELFENIKEEYLRNR